MDGLEGRTALVTGASRGIGAACARALAEAGARVVLAARSADALAEVAAGLGPDALTFVSDLAEPGAASALAARVVEATGGVDVLVNNAGIPMRRTSVDLTEADVDRVLAINVKSLLLLTTGLAPAMIERGGGSVVNVSSIAGVAGTPQRAAYAASKGAVDALTRALACEWGPHGIRVNSVAPGVIVTDIWAESRKQPGLVESVASQIALRRWGEPDDVADVVAFLASDASRYVTAQTIVVDGGLADITDVTAT